MMTPSRNLGRSEILGAARWTTLSKALGQGTTFLTTLVLARVLSKEDFGLFAMAMFYIWLLDIFIDIGISSAIVQRKDLGEQEVSSCFWLLVVGAMVVFILSWSIAPHVLSEIFSDERLFELIRLLSFAFFAVPITVVCTGLLSRSLFLDVLAKSELTACIARAVATVGFALNGFGVLSLVYGYLCERFILAALLALKTRWVPGWVFDLRGAASLLSFGGAITVTKFLWFAYSRLDILIIGRLLGAEILGIYSIAAQLANAFFQFISASYYRLVFPVLSRLQGSERFATTLLRASRTLAVVSLPIFFGLCAVAVDAVPLILGSRWVDAVEPLQVLSLVAAMQTMSGLLPQAINATGRAWVTVWINAGSVILFGCGFYLAAETYGLQGILITWLILFPIRYLVVVATTSAIVGFSLKSYLMAHARPLIASLLMVFVVYGIMLWVHAAPPVLRLITAICSGGIAYLAVTYFLCRDVLADLLELVKPSFGKPA